MGWERNEWGACKCHGQTFCPDWVFSHYEEDVPVFYRRSDVKALLDIRFSRLKEEEKKSGQAEYL